jgi:hypothetical protein
MATPDARLESVAIGDFEVYYGYGVMGMPVKATSKVDVGLAM